MGWGQGYPGARRQEPKNQRRELGKVHIHSLRCEGSRDDQLAGRHRLGRQAVAFLRSSLPPSLSPCLPCLPEAPRSSLPRATTLSVIIALAVALAVRHFCLRFWTRSQFCMVRSSPVSALFRFLPCLDPFQLLSTSRLPSPLSRTRHMKRPDSA